MNQGIGSTGFQLLANRHFNRLASRGPDPEASRMAPLPERKIPPVGITLSIGATAKSAEPETPKLIEGWRTKPMPADAVLTTTEQILQYGKDAEVLKERPDSEDPTRLALTEQANQFALGKGDNPFVGLSRQTLSTISYDDTGTYTTTEIAAAMREMREDDDTFWTETYKRIDDAAIKNGNDDDTRPMMIKAQLKLLPSMSEAEKTTLNDSFESLTIELSNWEDAGFKTPDAVEYSELLEPEAMVLAATTDKDGKAIWKQYSLRLLTADTTTLDLLGELPSTPATPADAAAAPTAKGQWLQIYAQIEHF